MEKELYCLIYNYGLHHIPVICAKEDFFKVIDSLSSEFEVFKEDCERSKSIIYYCIMNDHNEKEIIGSVMN